jgi:TolA-binding protein
MHKIFASNFVAFTCLLFLCLAPTSAIAASTDSDQTSAADIQREMKETLQTIASYSAEQRDAAVAKAKEALAKTDARIEQLQQQIDQNLQPMSKEARIQAQEALKTLRKQRTEIAEWYGGLKHSSVNAWDEIKKGFAKSYTELEKSLEKAREKF